jgi:hypothetical protein
LTDGGNVMLRARSNFMFGIRTPWTLSNDDVWARTHRFAGYTMTSAGLVMILSAAFVPPDILGAVVVSAIVAALVAPGRLLVCHLPPPGEAMTPASRLVACAPCMSACSPLHAQQAERAVFDTQVTAEQAVMLAAAMREGSNPNVTVRTFPRRTTSRSRIHRVISRVRTPDFVSRSTRFSRRAHRLAGAQAVRFGTSQSRNC